MIEINGKKLREHMYLPCRPVEYKDVDGKILTTGDKVEVMHKTDGKLTGYICEDLGHPILAFARKTGELEMWDLHDTPAFKLRYINGLGTSGVDLEITDFIKRRFPVDCNWMNGNCYYFAVILKARFPEGRLVYDSVVGHFMLRIKDTFYDYTGIAATEPRPEFFDWEELQKTDPLFSQHITRDVIK